jgi:hypothetical protein
VILFVKFMKKFAWEGISIPETIFEKDIKPLLAEAEVPYNIFSMCGKAVGHIEMRIPSFV